MMAAVLPPSDRIRLARVLALLGSNHAGERDAAALAAARIIRGAGITWSDLLLPEQPAGSGASPQSQSAGSDLTYCRYWAHLLSPWEAHFVSSLPCRSLSPKQVAKLHEIVVHLRERGAG